MEENLPHFPKLYKSTDLRISTNPKQNKRSHTKVSHDQSAENQKILWYAAKAKLRGKLIASKSLY